MFYSFILTRLEFETPFKTICLVIRLYLWNLNDFFLKIIAVSSLKTTL